MCPIIKATERNRGIHGVPFNFDDMSAQAGAYLDGVRAEAALIMAAAKKEAEQLRRKAVDEGRRAGQQAVRETVAAEVSRQMESALPALRQAVAEIEHARQAWLAHWEKSAVHVAANIARRVIRREIEHEPQITVGLAREALELAAGAGRLRIGLHPDDHAALAPQIAALAAEVSLLGETEIVADPSVSRGGCRLETRFGTIDQQIETQLARIAEELT